MIDDQENNATCLVKCIHSGYKWLNENDIFQRKEIVDYLKFLSGAALPLVGHLPQRSNTNYALATA